MIVSFTQTYGNNRRLLYVAYSRDKRMIEFKNHFDLNLHSFHNCAKETIDFYKKVNSVPNSEYLIFNGISYPQTIKYLKDKLKEIGATHLFFSQDDTFSDHNEHLDFKELIDTVKQFQKKFLLSLNYFRFIVKPESHIFLSRKTFNIYKITTYDYVKNHMWGMDDSPYICSTDLLDTIYDDNYLKFKNIWDAEFYLRDKFAKNIISRFLIAEEFPLFKNYNIIGKNVGGKEKELNLLKEKGIL